MATVDVQFAPKHLGLKIAGASLDGYVRVYDAADVMDRSRWDLEDYKV